MEFVMLLTAYLRKCLLSESNEEYMKVETLVEHIWCNCKCKFDSAACNSNQKWSDDKCQCECKKYRTCKIGCSRNSRTFIFGNCRYFKSILGDSVIVCNKIVNVADGAWTNVTDTISASVTSIVSVFSDYEKVRYEMDSYILWKYY